MSEAFLEVKDLKMHFPIHGGILGRQVAKVSAVDGVSLTLKKGETLGIVGESGCGKSTLGRAILRLYEPTAGSVSFQGQQILELTPEELKKTRRQMQMIFQDPFASLDPRMTIEKIVTEPYRLHPDGEKQKQQEKALELLKLVGLKAEDLKKYPHEFSGGQRQRIGIARAIALNPELIIADEPVAALDVSIQAQVLNLLNDLKKKFQLTYIFISHDLSVVKYFSDRVAVMYLGRVVEITSAKAIYAKPQHPYTRALMSAILDGDPSTHSQREILEGDVPSPVRPPSGCAFHPRCRYATDRCKQEAPVLREFSDSEGETHQVSCHRVGEF